MRILLLSDDFPPKSRGGAGVIAYNLAKSIKNTGHEVAVITTVNDLNQVGKIIQDGFEVYRLYSKYHERWRAYRSLYNPEIVKQLKNIINSWHPDIVHAHNIHYHLSYHCLRIAKKSGARVFLTAHDSLIFHYGKLSKIKKISQWTQFKKFKKRYNPFRNIIIRYYLKNVDRVFAVSHALKDALNLNGISNVLVIHNGINVDEWRAVDKDINGFKNKFNLINRKLVLFGGRLSGPKGGEKIVQAMSKIIDKKPEALLVVIGKIDDYSRKMISFAKELKIDKHLVFTDWISGNDLICSYYASDIVVVPSLYLDPFPTVNLEAMACKKPVVATCFGGSKEVVEDGKTGFVVNPYDIEEMSERILELLNDNLKAERFGRAGFDRIKSDFTLDIQTQETLHHYSL